MLSTTNSERNRHKISVKRNPPTGPPIDECGWRTQGILFSVRETELEEMNGHVCEQHQISDGHIQMSARQSRRQLLVPRSLQTNTGVQQSAQQHCPETSTRGTAVSVQVVWFQEHAMISDGDHDRRIRKAALRLSPVRSLDTESCPVQGACGEKAVPAHFWSHAE